MKKLLVSMFSVTMLLCGCSQSDDIIAGGGSDNADGLVPINIGEIGRAHV